MRHEKKKQILPKENTCFFIDDDNRTLLNLYQPFVVLWIGVDYLLPFSIVVLLCIYFYLYCLVDINEVLKESTGVWEQERILAIVEATANLCLNIVLVRKMGVAGVILATIMTILFINLPVEYYSIFRMYFKANGRDFSCRSVSTQLSQ